MSKRFIGVSVDGTVQTHIPHPDGNYATLCGLDGDDDNPASRQFTVAAGAKIDCADCLAIFEACGAYRLSDFRRLA